MKELGLSVWTSLCCICTQSCEGGILNKILNALQLFVSGKRARTAGFIAKRKIQPSHFLGASFMRVGLSALGLARPSQNIKME